MTQTAPAPTPVDYQPQIDALSSADQEQARQLAELQTKLDDLVAHQQVTDKTVEKLQGLQPRVRAVEETVQHLTEEDEVMKRRIAALAASVAIVTAVPAVAEPVYDSNDNQYASLEQCKADNAGLNVECGVEPPAIKPEVVIESSVVEPAPQVQVASGPQPTGNYRCYSDKTPVAGTPPRPGQRQGWCRATAPATPSVDYSASVDGQGITKWRYDVPGGNTSGLYRCTPDGQPATDLTPKTGLGWCRS